MDGLRRGQLSQGSDGGVKIALLTMHLAVGLAIIVLLRRASTDR